VENGRFVRKGRKKRGCITDNQSVILRHERDTEKSEKTPIHHNDDNVHHVDYLDGTSFALIAVVTSFDSDVWPALWITAPWR
jgi:hypothetical protein